MIVRVRPFGPPGRYLFDSYKGSTLKKTTPLKGFAGWKTLKYVLRHPIDGPRNLLALKGAKSMFTRKRAAVTAAVATTAVAVPLAVRAMKSSDEA